MIRTILIVILFSFTNNIAQQYNFIRYGVKDGLALSQISSIDVHSDGRLILGTYGGGFNIYDGKNFHLLNNLSGLVNNSVYTLQVQSDSLLWIGTEKGLSRYDGLNYKNFSTNEGLPSNQIWNLTLGKDNVLWIATTKGLARYKNGKIEKIKDPLVSNIEVWSLFADSVGNIWIGLKENLIIYNAETQKFEKKEEFEKIREIHSFAEDKNGNIWVGSDNGLYKITGNKYSIFGLESGLSSSIVWSCFFDSEDRLWLGTNNGATLFINDKFIKIGSNEGLTDYKVWTINEDFENNIWFGADEGLYKITDMSFRIYRELDNKPIDAWTIIEKSKNDYLIGSELQGALSFKNGKFTDIKIDEFDVRGMSVFFIDKNKNIWLTSEHGIYQYSNFNFDRSVTQYTDYIGSISCILQEDNGTIKFGSYYDETIEYDGKKFNKVINNLQGNPSIYYYLIDSQKKMWAATDSGVQIVSDDSSYIPKGFEELTESSFLNLVEDPYGHIWAGSYENGLICFNIDLSKTVRFDTISTSNGLNNNSIMALTFDADENLWISTNGGTNRLDVGEFHRTGKINILSYDLNDGITGVEGFQNAILTDSQNNVLISTIEGLVVFNPKNIKENNKPPTIQISSIKILDRELNEKVIDNFEIVRLKDNYLELPYNQNNLTIEFLGISLTNPAKVEYSYKLNDNEWSKPSINGKAYFPNLPYGKYTFQVKATNNNGVWNTNAKTLNFILVAPFWEKLWFQILAVILSLGVIFLFYLIRLGRMNKVNKDLEERIEEKIKYEAKLKKSERELRIAKEAAEKSDKLKSEFLAQMSHEIRTPINSILSYTSLLKEDVSDKIDESLNDGFSIIENSSHRLIRTIDSILNMSQLQTGSFELNQKNLNISNILKDLYDEFKNIASEKKLEIKLQLKPQECYVFADQYTITQLIANLIDNSIKYTNQGSITIRLAQCSEQKVRIEISDTGIGMSDEFQTKIFNPFAQEEQGYSRKYEGTGLGLSLVQKYAKLNDANLTFTSKKGEGTTFILELDK